ncbi:hypothetical protein J3F83DRAFT_95581 [Trichoderma novae-zelandiae]
MPEFACVLLPEVRSRRLVLSLSLYWPVGGVVQALPDSFSPSSDGSISFSSTPFWGLHDIKLRYGGRKVRMQANSAIGATWTEYGAFEASSSLDGRWAVS